jgi:hypothetical protein
MNAITVKLPWAAAIRADVFPDRAKTVENRGQRVADRHIGQRLAIHAGAAWDKNGAADERVRQWWWGRDDGYLPPLVATDFNPLRSKVIAVATLVDCHLSDWPRVPMKACCAPWGDTWYHSRKQAWHLVLADVVALPEPVPTRGYLSVPWTLPEDVAAQVAAQLEAVAP